mmetsp:Transcript_58162/g.104078  ORF Transcript_58162/g.104078 Transcript_58162/m.104078 type:complete len:330 (+) Transcript_58162:52-1041(+)
MGGSPLDAANSACCQRAHMLSGAVAGILEISLFHPVDTIAKRLIVDRRRTGLLAANSRWQHLPSSRQIVFAGVSPTASMSSHVFALYLGANYAVLYKVLQRSYQYSVQPMVSRYLGANHRRFFTRWFGPGLSRPMEHALAGSVAGCGEVLPLPIDSLKVKQQTNRPVGFRASPSDDLLTTLRGFYRGGMWMAMRNAIGSFVFFGGAALTKEHWLQLEDVEQATFRQHFLGSSAAAVLCVWISGPFDVLKTRVQRQGGAALIAPGITALERVEIRSGREIAVATLREEGPTAFFKGSVPKCAMVAPKLMFTYAVANWLHPWFMLLMGVGS